MSKGNRTAKLVDRRDVLHWLVGVGALPIVGCGSESSSSGPSEPGVCAEIPKEAAGPFPADGSNGPNALTSGVVRRDIRSSFGSMAGMAEGVPLTIELTLVDAEAGCAPLAGHAVYLWQSDRAGKYSLYDITSENYLRGVQEADSNGVVTFTSIFPACYFYQPLARVFWPHLHLEIYPSVASATGVGNASMTSQLALPEEACNEVYATPGYEQSASNLSKVSLKNDLVFAGDPTLQIPELTGSVDAGYLAQITIGVR